VPQEYFERPIPQLVQEAFATRYGQAVIQEGARVVRAGANPACLRDKGIDAGALEKRIEEIYVRNGTRRLEILSGFVRTQPFEAAVAARAGQNAKAEYRQLRADPEVQRYLAIANRIRNASVVDDTVETIARHLVINGVRAGSSLSPVASANERISQMMEEQGDINDREAFAERSGSPAVRRWRELEAAISVAMRETQDDETRLRYGPRQYTPDALRDFEGLCLR
jgi:hypothetical protein